MDAARLRQIAEQAAQEWENNPADTYERGFLAGVHQALTYARTHGTDIGDELDELIERADARERKTVSNDQLPELAGWWVHVCGEWQKIVAAQTMPRDETWVETEVDRHLLSGVVAVMSPLVEVPA